MKNPILRLSALLAFTYLFPSNLFAQSKEDVKNIISNYDLPKLKSLEERFLKEQAARKQRAVEIGKQKNWPEFLKKEDGSFDELMDITPNGQPIYFSIENINAAKSTRANFLHSGGALGLALNGQGMVGYVWDGGKVRASHQEYGGRITVEDAVAGPSGNNFHATHVTGTVAASGVVANAKGMAPQANVRTYNWTSDLSEAAAAAQAGMLLSNHSYGTPIVNNGTPLSPIAIGTYIQQSRAWDELSYDAPYYLMVVSAGNNGDDDNTDPSAFGLDKLVGNKVSKNNLVVANAQDANISASGNLVSVSINSSSSQGPADDMRVKPDITGNGTSVYSTSETSNSSYTTLSGTSMASPNVMGTLLLLQQHYKNLNNKFMKAATLKGLACHTADDAGTTGPDPYFGWGLLNAKKAAETITSAGYNSWISEETLVQGQTITRTFVSDGINPLQASISWTDLPGNVANALNSTTPILMNDLDIRITKGAETHFPWRLKNDNAGVVALNNGDNNVDNLEKIEIPLAAGVYTVTITHKGNLKSPSQDFSLVVTGVQSNFRLASLVQPQTLCTTQSAVLRFNHESNNTSTNTIFTVVGMPVESTAILSSTQASGAQEVTITLTNLQNVAPGLYYVGLKGTRGLDEEISYVPVQIFRSTFANVVATSPVDNTVNNAPNVLLQWNDDVNAENYRVQVSENPSFSSFVVNASTTENSYVANLSPDQTYYWRVLSSNRCGTATSTNAHTFSTGTVNCGNTFVASDFSDSTIGSTANSVANVPITVSGGHSIASLSVSLDITHTYVEDMIIYLEGPASIGSPLYRLFDMPCGEQDDIVATVSDAGEELFCSNSTPGISGHFLPVDSFISLNNKNADGIWTLRVVDPFEGDGGAINSFSLDICSVTTNLSTDNFEVSNISLYPNPANTSFSLGFSNTEDPVNITLYDLSGRKIFSKQNISSAEKIDVSGVSDGVYLVEIQNDKIKTSKKLVIKK